MLKYFYSRIKSVVPVKTLVNSNLKTKTDTKNVLTNEPMRLTKFLANTSVCSRREAEKLIAAGMILVDGKKVESNVPVTASNKI